MFFIAANPFLMFEDNWLQNPIYQHVFSSKCQQNYFANQKNHAILHIFITCWKVDSVHLPAWLFLLPGPPTLVVDVLLFACFSLWPSSMIWTSRGWCTASLRWTFHNSLHSPPLSSSRVEKTIFWNKGKWGSRLSDQILTCPFVPFFKAFVRNHL